jgi:hypothetical protein
MRLSSISLALVLVLLLALQAAAQPEPNLWERWLEHDAESTRSLDHALWARFLGRHLITDHPSGINLIDYGGVPDTDRRMLRRYIEQLESVAVSRLNRDVQAAYWINLYNAYTVLLVLEHYPVGSIRSIDSGLFRSGPWDKKYMEVEGEQVSLNDIEHRILRPIWQDRRIHYAVNCASLGCPNLMPVPFTGENYRRLFERGAREYINHPRGVAFDDARLYLSKIYRWYREDFEDSLQGVKAHIERYADSALAVRIREHTGSVSYRYDWSLNEP